jgi:hypothetical protein
MTRELRLLSICMILGVRAEFTIHCRIIGCKAMMMKKTQNKSEIEKDMGSPCLKTFAVSSGVDPRQWWPP